jgi:hypothetical protein
MQENSCQPLRFSEIVSNHDSLAEKRKFDQLGMSYLHPKLAFRDLPRIDERKL